MPIILQTSRLPGFEVPPSKPAGRKTLVKTEDVLEFVQSRIETTPRCHFGGFLRLIPFANVVVLSSNWTEIVATVTGIVDIETKLCPILKVGNWIGEKYEPVEGLPELLTRFWTLIEESL